MSVRLDIYNYIRMIHIYSGHYATRDTDVGTRTRLGKTRTEQLWCMRGYLSHGEAVQWPMRLQHAHSYVFVLFSCGRPPGFAGGGFGSRAKKDVIGCIATAAAAAASVRAPFLPFNGGIQRRTHVPSQTEFWPSSSDGYTVILKPFVLVYNNQ